MRQIQKLLFVSVCLMQFFLNPALAINDLDYVSLTDNGSYFPLVHSGKASTIYLSEFDFEGVQIAAGNLQSDVFKVSGVKPAISADVKPHGSDIVIIGTIGKNKILDKLIKSGKLDVTTIQGKWETFLITVVDKPMKGVNRAMIIAGSDKRGTIFGIYDLSEKIGVSPWYWWADVPIEKHSSIFIKPGKYSLGEPKVKYRGIFINDEAPALSGWASENFGGFNSKFYVHVFELILRLKGNFLWPAMWGSAFYDDDPLSPKLADAYGVVISTSHHEPMMRAHAEWSRYGKGPWNYDKNPEELQKFWRDGISRMGTNESLVTIGMRGDGDEPMTEGTAIELMERIVADQRKIIEEQTGKPAARTPQVWALYKEVQEYYDKGMRVPNDVTLLLCDDNWGNIRVVPKPYDPVRIGGYGIYYHFDFVGGPRNYKWLNTSQIERVWEQMNLSYRYGADMLWLVNVGDIKPMEFPISFFLDFAWNPDMWPANRLPDYYNNWASQQFGPEVAEATAEILALYTKYNARKKPEMLSAETYSLTNFREFETVVNDYKRLAVKANEIFQKLPESSKDAFYQLVLFPVEICANLNELYYYNALNLQAAKQQRNTTNEFAATVAELFARDSSLTDYYHNVLSNGKWNHIMSQTHIGYTSWQQPEKNFIPKTITLPIAEKASLGIAVENSNRWFPETKEPLSLPLFDNINNQTFYIELFNCGIQPLSYQVENTANWIVLPQHTGTLETEKRLEIGINWSLVPVGKHSGQIEISGSDNSKVSITVPALKTEESVSGFVENQGIVSIEASYFTKSRPGNKTNWMTIPNLGRTESAVTVSPVTAVTQVPGNNSPCLEYEIWLFDSGTFNLTTYLSPTLNFLQTDGLKYGISIDDETPQIINIHEGDKGADWTYPEWWNQSVSDNIRKKTSTHIITTPGKHTVKFWMVDPGIVLQRIVLQRTHVDIDSYLGPLESQFLNQN